MLLPQTNSFGALMPQVIVLVPLVYTPWYYWCGFMASQCGFTSHDPLNHQVASALTLLAVGLFLQRHARLLIGWRERRDVVLRPASPWPEVLLGILVGLPFATVFGLLVFVVGGMLIQGAVEAPLTFGVALAFMGSLLVLKFWPLFEFLKEKLSELYRRSYGTLRVSVLPLVPGQRAKLTFERRIRQSMLPVSVKADIFLAGTIVFPEAGGMTLPFHTYWERLKPAAPVVQGNRMSAEWELEVPEASLPDTADDGVMEDAYTVEVHVTVWDARQRPYITAFQLPFFNGPLHNG